MTSCASGLLVAALPTQTKLRELELAGIGLQRAARLADIARSTAQKIRQGQVSTVSRDVEHAILSVRKPTWRTVRECPPGRVKRILRALLGEDYTKHAVARRAGLRPEQLSRAYQRVTVKTHFKMLRVWHSVNEDASDGPFSQTSTADPSRLI
jgi:hypothetical protein